MTARTFEPGPLAAVDFHADGDRWTLTFVRDLPHPPEKVWSALTDPTQLEQWAPFNADRDLASPGPATLTMVSRDESMPMSASVIRADRPTLLEHTWGPDLLQWRLEAVDEGTRLTLRHTVADRELGPKVAAGWHICLSSRTTCSPPCRSAASSRRTRWITVGTTCTTSTRRVSASSSSGGPGAIPRDGPRAGARPARGCRR